MAKSVPVTLVHIRAFSPLSISFPPPGTYTGKIVLNLPNPDDSILARIGNEGSSQVTVDFTTDKWVTAETLRNMIAAQIPNLQILYHQISTPVRQEIMRHFREGRSLRDKAGSMKVMPLDDPLSSLQDEMPQGSWDEDDEDVED